MNTIKELSIRFDFLKTGEIFRFNGDREKNVKVSENQYEDATGKRHILRDERCKVIIHANN